MTYYRATFNTYEIMSPRNVHLGDNSMANAIKMGSIIVRVRMVT